MKFCCCLEDPEDIALVSEVAIVVSLAKKTC